MHMYYLYYQRLHAITARKDCTLVQRSKLLHRPIVSLNTPQSTISKFIQQSEVVNIDFVMVTHCFRIGLGLVQWVLWFSYQHVQRVGSLEG